MFVWVDVLGPQPYRDIFLCASQYRAEIIEYVAQEPKTAPVDLEVPIDPGASYEGFL